MGAEDDFDEVRDMINRILSDAVHGKVGHETEPLVRGSMAHARTGDEEDVVHRFLIQVPPDPGLPGPDIDATDDAVYVTMDLAGAAPREVRTKLAGRLLFIEVVGPRVMHRVVELPCDVESEARWTVRDGTLDLALRRRAARTG